MIGQITPLVQVAKRTWMNTVLAHSAGAALAAGMFGFVMGIAGRAIGFPGQGAQSEFLIGAVALVCAAREMDLVRWRLPMLRRQTPKWYTCAFGTTWGGFLWGTDLGLGWTTLVIFPGYYALVVSAFVEASPALGALLLGLYGIGRALPLVWAGILTHRLPLDQTTRLHVTHLPLIHRINATALAFVAGYLILGALL